MAGKFCMHCGDLGQSFMCDGGHWSDLRDTQFCSRCGRSRPEASEPTTSPAAGPYINNAVYGGDVTGGSKLVNYGTMTMTAPTRMETDLPENSLERHPTGLAHGPGSQQNLENAVVAGSVAGGDLTVNHGTISNQHTHVYRDDTRQTVPCGVCIRQVPLSQTLRPCPQCEKAVCRECNDLRQGERLTKMCLCCGKQAYNQTLELVYADGLVGTAELQRLQQLCHKWVIPDVLANSWRRDFERSTTAARPSVLELSRFDRAEIHEADALRQSGDPAAAIERLKPILRRFPVPPAELMGRYLSALVLQNPCTAEHDIGKIELQFSQQADDLALEFLVARHECFLFLDGHEGAQRAITATAQSRFRQHPRILMKELEARLDAWNTGSPAGSSTLDLIEELIHSLPNDLGLATPLEGPLGHEAQFLGNYLKFSRMGRMPEVADPDLTARLVRKTQWLIGGELLVSIEHKGQQGPPLRWPDGAILGRDPENCPRQMLYRLLHPHSTTPSTSISASLGCQRPAGCRCVFCLVASQFASISRRHFMMRRTGGIWCLTPFGSANGMPVLNSVPAVPDQNTPLRSGPNRLRLHGLSATLTVRPFPRYPVHPPN